MTHTHDVNYLCQDCGAEMGNLHVCRFCLRTEANKVVANIREDSSLPIVVLDLAELVKKLADMA